MTIRNSSRQERTRRKEPEKQTETQPRRKEEKCGVIVSQKPGEEEVMKYAQCRREVSGTEAKLLLKFLVTRELLVT